MRGLVVLALAIAMAARATSASMRQRAEREDEGRWVFLGAAAGAAFFSMFAILGVMQEAKAPAAECSAQTCWPG